MNDAFVEQDSIVYRNTVTFLTGYNIIADTPFIIGNPTSINSSLTTYNLFMASGGISGIGNFSFSNGSNNITFNNGNLFTINDTVDNFTCLQISADGYFNIFDFSSHKCVEFYSRYLDDLNGLISVDWGNRQLVSSTGLGNQNVSFDWNKKIMYGDWSGQNIVFSGYGNFKNGIYISGNPVITGGFPINNYRANTTSLGSNATTQSVIFSSPLSSTGYSVTLSYDTAMIAANTLWTTNKTISGFTINSFAGLAGGINVDYIAIIYN